MLFPIHPDTPQCKVFEILNTEVLHFLEKASMLNDLISLYLPVFRMD